MNHRTFLRTLGGAALAVGGLAAPKTNKSLAITQEVAPLSWTNNPWPNGAMNTSAMKHSLTWNNGSRVWFQSGRRWGKTKMIKEMLLRECGVEVVEV